MKNPFGKECRFFYGDYFRGRSKEECRLLDPAGIHWQPKLCSNCTVPDILNANACENMRFEPSIDKGFLRKPKLLINIHCVKCQCDVREPRIGCGECHTLPDVFMVPPKD